MEFFIGAAFVLTAFIVLAIVIFRATMDLATRRAMSAFTLYLNRSTSERLEYSDWVVERQKFKAALEEQL